MELSEKAELLEKRIRGDNVDAEISNGFDKPTSQYGFVVKHESPEASMDAGAPKPKRKTTPPQKISEVTPGSRKRRPATGSDLSSKRRPPLHHAAEAGDAPTRAKSPGHSREARSRDSLNQANIREYFKTTSSPGTHGTGRPTPPRTSRTSPRQEGPRGAAPAQRHPETPPSRSRPRRLSSPAVPAAPAVVESLPPATQDQAPAAAPTPPPAAARGPGLSPASAPVPAPAPAPATASRSRPQYTVEQLAARVAELEAEAEAEAAKRRREVALSRRARAASSHTVRSLLVSSLWREAKEARRLVHEEGFDVGRYVVHQTGPQTSTELWQEGYAFVELRERERRLARRRTALDGQKKHLANAARKRTRMSRRSQSAAGTGGGDGASTPGQDTAMPPPPPGLGPPSDTDSSVSGFAPVFSQANSPGGAADAPAWDDLVEAGEWVSLQLAQVKEEERVLEEDRARLAARKALHIRELRRLKDEEGSRFYRDRTPLADRYLPLRLLGRGGFSEVWKAFDLEECREVACKIHQLNPSWTEAKKASFTKHATREYSIHKSLNHPRIVRLFDVFEIDTDSFATVLELCEEQDLDALLKKRTTIPEREARAILLQILSALHYLSSGGVAAAGMTPGAASGDSSQRRAIIHYDLKPANILFDASGSIKITDFGLSKITDVGAPQQTMGVELTSQGAGTYWYLPPECFLEGPAPRISSKVDVWAVGVIFFEMLYGVRPFGHGETQEGLVSNRTILGAKSVKFPPTPKVSDQAKDFIRACLTYSQALRPDTIRICQHDYLKRQPRRRAAKATE